MKKYIPILLLLLFSCSTKENKIGPNDVVKKCVIVSYTLSAPRSTLDFEPSVTFYTNCGESVTTKNKHAYRIGDTLTFVYKKKP